MLTPDLARPVRDLTPRGPSLREVPSSCMAAPRITVVGSINLDLVARCERLPRPGETVSGATLARVPGGKGANQAVACARLGADVTMIGAIGRDSFAEEALAGLREADVTLDLIVLDEPTGVALVYVDGAGETEIVVAPGANAALHDVALPEHDAVLCQLEIPDEALLAAWEGCNGRLLPERGARAARLRRRGPDRRQPARARVAGAP